MANQVEDLYSGAIPVMMIAHLAVNAVQQPYDLANFVEASWLGYEPAGVAVFSRQTAFGAFVFLNGSVFFPNNSQAPQTPTCLYFTSMVNGAVNLVAVIPLPSGTLQVIPPGGIAWPFELTAWEGA